MHVGFFLGQFSRFLLFPRRKGTEEEGNVFLQFLTLVRMSIAVLLFPFTKINFLDRIKFASDEDSMYICMPPSQFDFTPLVSRNCKIATQRKKPEKSQNSIGSFFLKPKKIWWARFVDFPDQTGGGQQGKMCGPEKTPRRRDLAYGEMQVSVI